jgi:GDP-mannose 6-dehydrogenase
VGRRGEDIVEQQQQPDELMSSRISVFGLGYVGAVSAACFARAGNSVVGVDVNPTKIDMINEGVSPVVEPDVAEVVAQEVEAGRLRATTSAAEGVEASDVSFVCVGTPSRPNGSLELDYVVRVCQEIGAAIRDKEAPHTVVIRSTVLPGSTEEVVLPTLEEASGRRAGKGFGLSMNPEFLREASSLKDFYDPPFTVIGTDDEEVGRQVAALYDGIDAPLYVVPFRAAEMVKYACNAFHGLKVSFANEIGNIAKELGADSHQVMEIFVQDTKLNISPYYLKPGFAFGGSCLPKDLRAITHKAREVDVPTPVLDATLESNRLQIERGIAMALAPGHRRIGILGMSFKAGTDDLRESPVVRLIEALIGKGMELSIYDADVTRSRLLGANREYIEGEIPHIWELVRPTIEEVVEASDTIVIGNPSKEFKVLDGPLARGKVVVDLVRIFDQPGLENQSTEYRGISW